MKKYRTAFLGSTRGTVLKPIFAAWELKQLSIEPVGIFTDRQNAPIRLRAEEHGLPSFSIAPGGKSREEFDRELSAALEKERTELVVFCGFMRIVSPWFVQRWKGRVINTHPSLLPAHKGKMDMEVHRAVVANKESFTGCTIHLVSEEVDGGEIIMQKKCPVLPEDTPETVKAKVQNLEVQCYMKILSAPEEYLPELNFSFCISS